MYKPLRFPINVVYDTFSFINYYLERLRQGHDCHSPYGVFCKRISDNMGVDKQIIASSYILNFFFPRKKSRYLPKHVCFVSFVSMVLGLEPGLLCTPDKCYQ